MLDFDVVLTDIEGTTTPISFVRDVLFPYVRTHLNDYVNRHWDDALAEWISLVREQALKDAAEGAPQVPLLSTDEGAVVVRQQFIANVLWQMDRDRKTTGLKGLQADMWKSAYEQGLVKGVVYDDVVDALKRWKEQGLRLFIYSSGSVDAQRLLFGYSTHGDLNPHFQGNFDTKNGSKLEPPSYTGIAVNIGADPARILFLTDNIGEARAARTAGYQVVVLDRPGNAPLADVDRSEFRVITSFEQLFMT